MALEIIDLSLKIASYGYTGPIAKPFRMLHSLASHLMEFDSVSNRLPDSFETNRKRLNDYFTKDSSPNYSNTNNGKNLRRSLGEHFVNWIQSYNDGVDEGCPGGTDGCPSYCYEVGGCGIENKCDNECFGLCGEGCDCWSWVCGDCDCHCLCENHDYFCSCESVWEYQCWAFWEWLDDDCD